MKCRSVKVCICQDNLKEKIRYGKTVAESRSEKAKVSQMSIHPGSHRRRVSGLDNRLLMVGNTAADQEGF